MGGAGNFSKVNLVEDSVRVIACPEQPREQSRLWHFVKHSGTKSVTKPLRYRENPH